MNWIYICYVEESRPPPWSNGQNSWLQNGDVLCFLRGMNWIYICYVEESRPSLWFSGQGSWLQIQMSGFDSRRYNIFWEIVGLEWGPLSLVSSIEGLLGRKGRVSGLEIREYGRRDPSCWPRAILYPQNLALTSLTSGGRSVGIVRSRTQATEFSLIYASVLLWGAVVAVANSWPRVLVSHWSTIRMTQAEQTLTTWRKIILYVYVCKEGMFVTRGRERGNIMRHFRQLASNCLFHIIYLITRKCTDVSFS
jgi:hypothetical protein